jgi:hypothetical protein
MTVFIAHAPEDRAVAESLEKAIERRGQFAELEDGSVAQRPIQASDALVLLVSQKLMFAPTRLRLERRALDAWADGRLIVVKLDHGIAPVGLRDLPMIDASFEAQRDPFTWMKVADAVAALLRPPAPPPLPASQTTFGDRGRIEPGETVRRRRAPGGEGRIESPSAPAKKSGVGAARGVFFGLASLAGMGAAVVTGAIWLANRIGPTPGGFAELVAGIDAFAVRYSVPAGVTPWLFAAAIALMLLAPLLLLRGGSKARSAPARGDEPQLADEEAAVGAPPGGGEAPGVAVFVSYARANQGVVLPVIEAARETGRKFWVDQQGGISAGDGWAGEIVRAIREAAGVVVMCSKAAFESDHVKREIYLADRYRKKLVPVFIEQAEPPEDFEYFFAGVQHLNLFETPESERPKAFVAVLG